MTVVKYIEKTDMNACSYCECRRRIPERARYPVCIAMSVSKAATISECSDWVTLLNVALFFDFFQRQAATGGHYDHG